MSSIADHEALLEVIKWIDENLTGIELPTDERSMLSAGCFDVSIEHQAAIALLFSSGLYGSMFALLRVVTESLVRGLWLLHCATDAELSQFKKGQVKKEFGTLIKEIENSIGISTPVLSNLKAIAWTAMNGFTHTGFNQVSRRHGEGSVGSNYPDDELNQAQSLTGALGLIAAVQLASLANLPDLIQDTMQRMQIYAKRESNSLSLTGRATGYNFNIPFRYTHL